MKNFGFVKCAISTLNGNLSNPSINAEKMFSLIKQAEEKGVKILVFPELSLTGYTCQDLFGNEQLLDESMNCLKNLVMLSSGMDILFVVGAPINVDDTLYNCAVVIQDGSILGVVPKQYLPNYNEFYEKRWFSPYIDFSKKEITLFERTVPFGNLVFASSLGYKFGIEICEDLWAVIPPSSYLALEGCNIIANLSASNELVGKDDYRKDLVRNQSARTMSAYLYVSAGFSESTSDTVFGGSGYVFENGKELVCLQRFQMTDTMKEFEVDVDFLSGERRTNKTYSDNKRCSSIHYTTVWFEQNEVINFELSRFVNPHPFIPNIVDEAGGKVCREILDIQSTALARRITSIKNTNVTIGISGGLDSTLALVVCYETFKRLNLDLKGIIAITMPGFGTTSRTKNNASQLCNQMGVTLKEISIKDACLQHFKDIGHDVSVYDITYENVQARERTQILMDMANKYHGFVIGTGDLSESALGWCTYNGDHMSMYNVNCSVPKSLVKYLIEWYAKYSGKSDQIKDILLDILDTPISPELLPSDGKEIVQMTESSTGPYEVVDFIMYHFLRNKFSGPKILYLAGYAFKDKYSQKELLGYYRNFTKRFFTNQFKRNCVPDGPKIGSVSLSPRADFRAPSDADMSAWLTGLEK